jgi:ketosteroid isomerase-like protein
VVGLGWREPNVPERNQLFQVLRFRDGRVVDMEDFPDRSRALKAVGARA